MKWTTDNVRDAFLNFFKDNGHTIVESSPLLPAEDKTLLFANAGMNQFKNLFTGQEKRSYTRACSSQKCVRAGGKHNDLENVGFTARHHTFFEMLGNFSFGDYFKEDAIKYCWKLLTEVFKLDINRLYVTVFRDDDEAAEIWEKKIGVDKNRIFRLGEKDNFWAMGDTGPCGPCSEVHYDMWDNWQSREHFNDGEPDWDCGRFVEIWNLVFMQFERDASGSMKPLPKPSIDTGMGLERITAALNGVSSNYDTDIFVDLINFIMTLPGCKADSPSNPSLRVIADHARATSFLIADSITPSNEGRGYVLRRIMRRAIRHGNKIGFKEPFFSMVCKKVIELMGHHYGELNNQSELILNIVLEEEKRFMQTLDRGLELLNNAVRDLKDCGDKLLSGEIVFKLYDTYGFPEDLTETILEEHSLSYNKNEYEKAMELQKERGRASWDKSEESLKQQAVKIIKEHGIDATPFNGYKCVDLNGDINLLFNSHFEVIDTIGAGEKGYAVLSPLLFYAESGGQTADRGMLVKNDETVADVIDCIKIGEYRVVVLETRKELFSGEKILQILETKRRQSIKKNHSATHLLHRALKEIIGQHANQAGSLVTPERLRFDFNHYAALTSENIEEIERRVNEMIQEDNIVDTAVKSIEEAKKDGATALFGEKYGETVRVVSMGESKELCGGTHVSRTGEIGAFKIVKEEGIAAGIRRVEAVTGMNAFAVFQNFDKIIADAAKVIGTERAILIPQIEKLRENLKLQTKQIDELMGKIGALEASTVKPLSEKDGIELYLFDSGKGRQEIAKLSDSFKSRIKDGLFVIKGEDKGKSCLIVSASGKALELYDSGKIIKELLAPFGGKGGGKKDVAQGGADAIDFDSLKAKFMEII